VESTREITVLNKISRLKMNSVLLLESILAANEETGAATNDFNFLSCLNGEPGYEFREYSARRSPSQDSLETFGKNRRVYGEKR